MVMCGVTAFLAYNYIAEGKESSSPALPNLTDVMFMLDREPEVIEKEVVVQVPAAYLEVNGRNYTSANVLEILEVKGYNALSFDKWIKHLFNIAEGQMSFHFNAQTYGPGEYEVEDVESNECIIRFEHIGFDEGVILCGDVEIETDDAEDLECSVEIFFERNNKYELGKVRSCEIDIG